MTTTLDAAPHPPRDGLVALDAAATEMPGWIMRGLAIRILGSLSLLLPLPLALPWNETLTIPLTIVGVSPAGTGARASTMRRAIGTVPDTARGDLVTGMAVRLSFPIDAAASGEVAGRIVEISDGTRFVVALPGAPPSRATRVTGRVVVRRGSLGDAIFGNILKSIDRRGTPPAR